MQKSPIVLPHLLHPNKGLRVADQLKKLLQGLLLNLVTKFYPRARFRVEQVYSGLNHFL